MSDHIVNAIRNHQLVSDSTLHVVAVLSNPARYHSRYRLAREFCARMRATANVKLHMVELAFGDRHHELTHEDCDSILQLRSSTEIWSKENMINLGVKHLLPRDWRYVAWIDADVQFANPGWALETIHALQHRPYVQPFTHALDLNHYGDVMTTFQSFCSLVQRGEKLQSHPGEPYKFGHPGFAHACTRLFWENVGGLIEGAVLGAADSHMCWGLVGRVECSVNQKVTDGYKRMCQEWADRAYRETNGHVGAIGGYLSHFWHGSKRRRFYRERWDILVRNQYDPYKDLRRDAQGLLHIVGKPRLCEEIRQYMSARQEDGVEE